MLDTLLDMKTATVREVQHKLSRVLARVKRGEEVTITKRGKVVARLVPPPVAQGNGRAEWPDFAGRMKRLFPEGPPSGTPTSEVVMELRRERS
jgi:prevent-host-death family protein